MNNIYSVCNLSDTLKAVQHHRRLSYNTDVPRFLWLGQGALGQGIRPAHNYVHEPF